LFLCNIGIPQETRTLTNGFGDRGAAITLERIWRKTEESNPIPVKRTWFSRPVGGPSHLHHLPYRNTLSLTHLRLIRNQRKLVACSCTTNNAFLYGTRNKNRTYTKSFKGSCATTTPFGSNKLYKFLKNNQYCITDDAVCQYFCCN
jgi:hypothetical protein